jgi:hypothetical protein
MCLLMALALFVPTGGCGSSEKGPSDLEFVDPPSRGVLTDAGGPASGADASPAPTDISSTLDTAGPSDPDVTAPLDDADTSTGSEVEESDSGSGSPDTSVSTDAGVSGDVSGDVAGDVAPVNDGMGSEDAAVDVADDASVDQDSGVEDVTSDIEAPDGEGPADDAADVAEDDVTEVEACSADEDCPGLEQPCSVATCDAGVCGVKDAPLGTPCTTALAGADAGCVQSSCDIDGACVAVVLTGSACDDGSPCTAGEACDLNGVCLGGSTVLCPSTGPCEIGVCDLGQGCVPLAVPDGLLCDDDDPCTVQTECADGVCGGGNNLCACLEAADCYEDGDFCNGVPACVDLEGGGKGCQIASDTVVSCEQPEDPCFIAVCEPSDGSCSDAVLAGGSCDDGDACTQGDACDDDGGCAGLAIVCDDGIPCTGDQCDSGLCVYTSLDGAECNDGDPCTVKDTCFSATCSGEAKSCDDGKLCTIDTCTDESGLCTHTFDDGASCDDASACTEQDLCSQGVCLGSVVHCDDENLCTDDACEPESGCIVTPNTVACPDGDVCTGPDVCDQGECLAAPIVCDDAIACTVDACEPGEGCVHTPDTEACDDGNPCTTDKCLVGKGCISVPNTLECDDGSLCTFGDVCAGGLCAGQPIVCNDGVDCTEDMCDTETGFCQSVADDAVCDDGNPCTVTGCDLDTGCVKVEDDGAECDDDVACTEGDQCAGGICTPGANICPCEVDADCDDEDLCNGVYACEGTADGLTECVAVVEPVVCSAALDTACLINRCDGLSGVCGLVAVQDGAPCVDTDACTSDEVCVAGACDVTEVTCEDGVDCTIDTCAADIGCVHTPSEGDCDDAVDCTVDACLVLTGCIHEPDNATCTDDVPCTVDTCHSDTGCDHVEDSGPCDDGVGCTLDVCDLEAGCFSVLDDAECDDGSPCTAAVCTDSGCISELVEGDCEDGSLCTTGDLCVSGVCQSGSPVDCEDGDLCTKNTCSLADGSCLEEAQPDGTACDDGSFCTELDSCGGGACLAGAVATCDDALACTIDACDPATGCAYTTDDSACDDSNPCTIDQCVAGQGCVYTAVSDFTSCDDGTSGTTPDVCFSGLCRGGQNASVGVPTLWCQIESASLAKVSAFDGSVYALMNYQLSGILCGTVPCLDGGGYCHSRVLRLDGVTTSAVASLGGRLTGLSHDGVVGESGQVGQIALGGFAVYWGWSDLADAITNSGMAGGSWTDIWGTPLPDGNATAYTLVGRTSADGPGRVVQCRLDDQGAECDSASLDFDEWSWDEFTPAAVSGILSDSTPLAAIAVQGTTATAPSGVWLTEDSEEFAFTPLGPSLSVHGVLRPTVDSAWLFGADGLLASFDNDGWSTWSPVIEGLSLYAAAMVGKTLVAVGDHPETDEAWLVALDLEGEPEDPESWHAVSLGKGYHARDVYASTEGLTIVGAEIQADGTTRPYLWHLKL